MKQIALFLLLVPHNQVFDENNNELKVHDKGLSYFQFKRFSVE